jgi:hypothetical protein
LSHDVFASPFIFPLWFNRLPVVTSSRFLPPRFFFRPFSCVSYHALIYLFCFFRFPLATIDRGRSVFKVPRRGTQVPDESLALTIFAINDSAWSTRLTEFFPLIRLRDNQYLRRYSNIPTFTQLTSPSISHPFPILPQFPTTSRSINQQVSCAKTKKSIALQTSTADPRALMVQE